MMRASVGDWLVIKSGQAGGKVREGMVVQSPRADGAPPWRVKWTDSDRESVVFPGPDGRVLNHAPHAPEAPARAVFEF